MTDRQPDDLFDTLRDRLHDHGQVPPDHLWAGIRQQLPPPVAAPQRRRRRFLGLLLASLLLVVSVGGWSVWQFGGAKNTESGEGVRPHLAANAASSAQSTAPTSAALSRTKAAIKTAFSSAESTAAATTAQRRASVAQSAQTVEESASPDQATAGSLAKKATAGNNPSVAQLAVLPTAQQGVTRQQRRRQAEVAVVVGSSSAKMRRGKNTAPEASSPTAFGTALATLNASRTTASQSSARKSASNSTAVSSTETLTHTSATSPALAISTGDTKQPSYAVPTAKAPAEPAVAQRKSVAITARPAATPLTAADLQEQTQPQLPVENATENAGMDGLNLRRIGLQLGQWPAPAVQPVADTIPRTLLPVAPRWAVQVVLGPSLTFRQLTSPANLSYAGSAIVPHTGGNFDANASTNVATLERPALGQSLQVQLHCTLNGRWAVAAGLGYREYATALAIRLHAYPRAIVANMPTAIPPVLSDSTVTGTVHRRDTYRFLTVPVQFSYALGARPGRLRPALLLGAELGVYLGGTTSEGSACNCVARTWTPTGSPYRPLSLSLSLGADLRYRLGPLGRGPWELLAQPTAVYGLTSLARAGSGYYERRPYALGLLLGVSYDLR